MDRGPDRRFARRVRARAAPALLLGLAAVACSGSTSPGETLPPVPSYPPPPLACAGSASPFADHLLVGFSGSDATAERPGFHLRYQYLAGPLAPDADCYRADRTTTAGCGTTWWGTWQWDQLPPGQFVRDFVARAKADGLLPMFTWYVILPASGVAEGAPEVTQAATDVAFMSRYLADFRFFLDQLGADVALVHVEPDFWGYAQHVAIDAGGGAADLAAAVASANPADCGSDPNSIAGLGQCMIRMVRLHAPNALVALHGSAWASGRDCVLNTDPTLDVAAEAATTAAFLSGCGAGGADLVVVDIADRDAGWRAAHGQDTWIGSGAALPNYAQAFTWSRALGGGLALPLLWWQVPVGNTGLPNQVGAWQDDKVERFFGDPGAVAASGAVGMAFGAGNGEQTTPETDRGYLAACAAALAAAGGQPLCP